MTGGLVVALALVGGVSIYSLANLNQTTQLIVTDPLPGMATIAGAQAAALTMRGDVWRHIATADASTKAQLDREIEDEKTRLAQSLQEYEKTITTPEDRALFEKIKAAWQQYAGAYPAALALSRAGKGAEASSEHNSRATPHFNALRDALGAEADFNKKRGETLAAESQQSYKSTLWVLWITLGLSILSGGGLAYVIVRSTNRVLRQTVTELSEGAEQTASAASQISSSSQSLAQGSSEQAASLEETSASSEEINSMACKNTENSRQAAEVTGNAGQKFAAANSLLDETVRSMDEIQSQSSRISKIIKTIDEIAFQTNILALNAAVEAARAGEAGMGFAVVADEVRNLAQRCAQAAKDTSALIEESIAKSADGKSKVDQVASAIRDITQDVVQVKTLVDEVHLGSQEQARGTEQIGKAISQMEQVTQRSAASAEESASAAEELSAQSETLREIAGRLTAMVGGGEVGNGSQAVSRWKRVSAAHPAAATPQHHREPVSSLSALRSAVAHKPGNTHSADPVLAGARAGKNALPFEDEFKDF